MFLENRSSPAFEESIDIEQGTVVECDKAHTLHIFVYAPSLIQNVHYRCSQRDTEMNTPPHCCPLLPQVMQ